ncbi:putative C6 transcription factor [Aspergillus foveolatus]|uniref:putative C6 transcription factor n=1 Tax=Aspergillus foveolatus TaxID=210207 RepID=UPI003CCD0535
MRFNCQTCVRKKIKCDRVAPTCSSCGKAKLECVYQAPPPRAKRKRSQSEDVYARLARYERILQDNNLLPSEPGSCKDSCEESSTSMTGTSGQLLLDNGQSRYINSVLLDTVEGGLCQLSDLEHDDIQDDFGPNENASSGLEAACAILGAIRGSPQSLIEQHPSYEQATKLWGVYIQNVEPLCKVLHVPTVVKMVNTVSKQPAMASKSDECLLFVIYYFAVFSMSDAECLQEFNTSRARLLSRFRTAFFQALVNASWLKTASITVLQAYTLFLISMRTQLDSNTFWILTGVAVRLSQRMGLHRDGETLGLPPFEVQMRRRLFWQLLPLDGYAGQVSGTGISIAPNSWDTKQPLNISDDQIFPGMTQQPKELRCASEMIFCLSRIELSNFYTRTGVKMKEIGASIEFKDAEEIERLINEVEDSIETRFLRYCDIVNPLHILTTGIVRSATNAVRLRARMPLLMKGTITDAQRRDTCTLAEKILDTNNAIYGNPAIRKFRWQTQAFFLWDALLCILRNLALAGFYSPSELDSVWNKIIEIYRNHEELVISRRALHTTIGKETLKAWDANPPSNSSPEPSFIVTLRAKHEEKVGKRQESINGMVLGSFAHVSILDDLFSTASDPYLDLDSGFTLDSSDWAAWDQLSRGPI